MIEDSKQEKERGRGYAVRRCVVRHWPFVLLAVGLSAFLLGQVPFWLKGDVSTANEYGDSFGFINAMVAALAFAALIVTLLMQSEELELQRRELRLTRRAMKKSAHAQAETARLTLHGNYLAAVTAAVQHYDGTAAKAAAASPQDEQIYNGDRPVWTDADAQFEELKAMIVVFGSEVRGMVSPASFQARVDRVYRSLSAVVDWAMKGISPPPFLTDGLCKEISDLRTYRQWLQMPVLDTDEFAEFMRLTAAADMIRTAYEQKTLNADFWLYLLQNYRILQKRFPPSTPLQAGGMDLIDALGKLSEGGKPLFSKKE